MTATAVPAGTGATGSEMNKVFLIGSPRSGTTLLQSILAAAGDLYTLKETHFLIKLHRPRPFRPLDRWHLAAPRRGDAFAFLAEHAGLAPERALATIGDLRTALAVFDDLLTAEARRRGQAGWLEKSPEHMLFIGELRAHIAGARFVHIVRDGRDVVASLYDAFRKYPEHWGWLNGLDRMIRLYNQYLSITRANYRRPDTFVLRYDDILERDAASLAALARFLGLPEDALDLERAEAFRADIVRADEPWKVRKEQGIVDTRGGKFERLFAAPERARIAGSLASWSELVSG